jgi:hypothetical protein
MKFNQGLCIIALLEAQLLTKGTTDLVCVECGKSDLSEWDVHFQFINNQRYGPFCSACDHTGPTPPPKPRRLTDNEKMFRRAVKRHARASVKHWNKLILDIIKSQSSDPTP